VTIAQNNETLQFPSGVKIVDRGNSEELLVTTSRLQSFILDTLNPADYNYRILSGTVSDLVRNTICDPAYTTAYPSRT